MRVAADLATGHDLDDALDDVIGRVRTDLGMPPDLAVLLASPEHADRFDEAADAVRGALGAGVLFGGVAQGIAGPGAEVEDGPALSLWAAAFGGGSARTFRSRVVRRQDGASVVMGWPDTRPGDVTICLADPYSFPTGQVLGRLATERPGHVVVGGQISGGPGATRLLVDEVVADSGAVGVVLRGVEVRAVVSQGCRPVGEPLVVTGAHHNVIETLGGQPATQRLAELVRSASPAEADLVRRGLHIGLVADEYRDEFTAGDFLIRAVLEADPEAGVTVGDEVQVGRIVQFQVRDATTADEELRHTLRDVGAAAGALLFTCNGRGAKFFGVDDHDVDAIETSLGGPVAGAFCAGEIGPVGPASHLHGFTASLAVFGAVG